LQRLLFDLGSSNVLPDEVGVCGVEHVRRLYLAKSNKCPQVLGCAAFVVSLEFERKPSHYGLTNDMDDVSFSRLRHVSLTKVLAVMFGIWDEDGKVVTLVIGMAMLGK
jgi:hypothetical protein